MIDVEKLLENANREIMKQKKQNEDLRNDLFLAKSNIIKHDISNNANDIILIQTQILEMTLDSIGDAVISTDINMNVAFLNRVAEELTGWDQKDAVGKPIYEIFNISNEYSKERQNIIEYVIETGNIQNLENHTRLFRKDGKKLIIEDSAAPIKNMDNIIIGVVVVFRDYTEKWKKLKEIERLSYKDQLTGLYNRRFFEEEIKKIDNKANFPITIAMGDINGLKLINDSFGHVMGDEILKLLLNIY